MHNLKAKGQSRTCSSTRTEWNELKMLASEIHIFMGGQEPLRSKLEWILPNFGFAGDLVEVHHKHGPGSNTVAANDGVLDEFPN